MTSTRPKKSLCGPKQQEELLFAAVRLCEDIARDHLVKGDDVQKVKQIAVLCLTYFLT